MMGDRDFQSVVQDAISSIRKEIEIDIDPADLQTVHLHEVVQCLRRSYYDRIDPQEKERRGFSSLLAGLLKKLQQGGEPKEFVIEDIKLHGQADMIVDDSVLVFRGTTEELESPRADDVLYLNACLWIYDKTDGVVVYITCDKREIMFSISRNKKMFEEIIRRVRVLNDLLKEQKTPILEPSVECSECQYYERCFMKRKNAKQLELADMLGLGKKKD